MSDLSRKEILSAIEAQEDLPEKVKECEKSIKEEQPELDKSQRIAICRDQLDMAEEGGCLEGEIYVNGQCVETEEVDIVPPTNLSLPSPVHLASFDPEAIERIEEGDNTVRYTNIKLIGPGAWTDSNSREQVWYGSEGMRNLEVDSDNSIHINHDSDNDTSEVGYIDPDAVENADNGVFGDLVLDTSTAAGEFADENMRTTLESGGAKGFGGPSVEIPPDGQRVEFNAERGMPELRGGRISDVALVSNPGAKDVHFARQTAQAAVALSDSQSVMAPDTETSGMSDATVAADTLLETFDLEADDLDLSEDRELADVPVSELVALIAESYGADPAEIMEALDPFIDGEDSEMQEDDEEEDEDGEGEEGDGEEEEEEDEEGDDVDINMEEQVSALEERVAALEDMLDSVMAADELEEELEELADADAVAELEATIEELEDAKSDLEERTRELEDTPQDPRTLSGDAEANGDDGDVDGPISAIEPSTSY